MDAERAQGEIERSDLDSRDKLSYRVFLALHKNLLLACKTGEVVATVTEAVQQSAGQSLIQQLSGPRRDTSVVDIRNSLWNIPEPELPTTARQVSQWLFEQPSLRIPVMSSTYHEAVEKLPTAAQYLSIADSALSAVHFAAVVQRQPTLPITSETDVTAFINLTAKDIWNELSAKSPRPLRYSLQSNSIEADRSHSSRAQKPKLRPDTMVVVSKCTLLLGEHQKDDLQAAFDDLRSKRAPLRCMHYRDVRFVVGYAAADTLFQWCFLHAVADKEIELVGPQLDLMHLEDRCKFLLSWVQVYRLLTVMSEHLDPFQRRLALYTTIVRGPGREVQILGDCVLKKINKFSTHASELHTSYEAICKAYRVASAAEVPGQQFLITSKDGPSLRGDRYRVITMPCGYPATVKTEQDLHAVAVTCCLAAKALHSAGLVHRDLRLDNVVQLGPKQFIVIDLESATFMSTEPLPQNFGSVLHTCTSAVLDTAGCFTSESDMYLIGRLLEAAMPNPYDAAVAFIKHLLHKRLSAGQALHYLQHVWQADDTMQP